MLKNKINDILSEIAITIDDLTPEQKELLDLEIANAKKGLFTEDDLTKRVTAEVDRRVESGIQKGIETQKEKWKKELEERAKLSAEDLARKEFDDKLKEMSAKEKEIAKKENKIEAISLLNEAGIPKNHYSKFIDVLINDNSEATNANIQNFINMFNETKSSIESDVKTQLSRIPAPEQNLNNDAITKDVFNKMSYADKMKFKSENPEKFKEFIK